MNDKKIVLVVGMGTSPAVMTETVWALAHQSESVVPDEIVVITTKSGKDALRTAIMSGAPSVWNRLKTALAKEKIAIDGKLVFGDTSIRVIPDADGNEASDLRTGADNLRAADFMLTSIQAKHSQKPIVSGSMRHAFYLLTKARMDVVSRYSTSGARVRTEGAAMCCATGSLRIFMSGRLSLRRALCAVFVFSHLS